MIKVKCQFTFRTIDQWLHSVFRPIILHFFDLTFEHFFNMSCICISLFLPPLFISLLQFDFTCIISLRTLSKSTLLRTWNCWISIKQNRGKPTATWWAPHEVDESHEIDSMQGSFDIFDLNSHFSYYVTTRRRMVAVNCGFCGTVWYFTPSHTLLTRFSKSIVFEQDRLRTCNSSWNALNQ